MMDTLGDFLKHRREEVGLSLEELAGRTRIRIENLRSLEREDLDALPTEIYVRGFVKLVCRELGLEPSDGIVRYETLRRQSGPPDEMTWDEETTEVAPGILERALGDPERVVHRATVIGRWAGIGVGAVAGIVLLVLAFRWIDPFAPRTTKPVAILREEPGQVPAPDLATIPERKPAEEPKAAEPAPKEQPAATQPPPVQEQKLVASRQPPAPAPTPAAAPTPKTVAPSAGSAVVAPPAAEPRAVLRLEATRPVQVSVLLDGTGFPRTRALAGGESATWKADDYFVLDATDGGAVRVFLGGKDQGRAGEDGVPVEGLSLRAR